MDHDQKIKELEEEVKDLKRAIKILEEKKVDKDFITRGVMVYEGGKWLQNFIKDL